jgi:hypothetical protein
MNLTSPRRKPRVAGVVFHRDGTATVVVLDVAGVRATLARTRLSQLRYMLLAERPDFAVAVSRPPWIRMLALKTERPARSIRPARLSRVPELRRFLGTPDAGAIARAFAIAHSAINRRLK